MVKTMLSGVVVVFALVGLGLTVSCTYKDLAFLHDIRVANERPRAARAAPAAEAK